MPSNFEDMSYKGPDLSYKPHIGLNTPSNDNTNTYVYKGGWHNIDYLRQLLDGIEKACFTIYSQCEDIMRSYSIIMPQDDIALADARTKAFPTNVALSIEDKATYLDGQTLFDDLTGKFRTGEVPGSISFNEYIYYTHHTESAAATYIANYFEDKTRNPGGTNAVDIARLAIITNSEVKRIKEFINVYIGEVDHDSEFRAVESFQSWAEDALEKVQNLWQVLTGKIAAEIPRSEMDQLDSQKASELQALFQVKLNIINKNIKDALGQLYKNWNDPSNIFYHNNLGPALQFQLKVGRSLTGSITTDSAPTLSSEIQGTMAGLNSNYSVLLSDMIKRKNLYNQYIEEVLLNIVQRDTYCKYLDQLATLGKPIANPFTTTSDDTVKAFSVYDSPVTTINTSVNEVDTKTFQPLHSSLSGLDDPAAHPQYLLRTGGEDSIVTGDIVFTDGVTIDGIDPSKHAHTGKDGSVRIHGSDIDYNSITDENIDNTNASTSIPDELTLVSQVSNIIPPGITKVAAKVSFNVDTTSIVSYEFEVTPLPIVETHEDPAQSLLDEAILFHDFRYSVDETTLPSGWLGTNNSQALISESGELSFDDDGLLFNGNSTQLSIPLDNANANESTVVWSMSRDTDWKLSTFASIDEGFEIDLVNTGAGKSIEAAILAVLNDDLAANVGTIHINIIDASDPSKLGFSDGSRSIHDFGSFYTSISPALICILSLTNNGLVLRTFGLSSISTSESYSGNPELNDVFNILKLKTNRHITTSPNTPVMRIHAIGVWNKNFTDEESAKIAAYLLTKSSS